MNQMLTWLFRPLSTEREGQTLVEYALILALIAVVTVAILTQLGTGVVDAFTSISNAF